MLLLAAARPLSEVEKNELLDQNGFPDWDYMPGEDGHPFEFKASDWGYIGNKLVALDYSTPAHDTAEEEAEYKRRALL